ncbi:hypothetical protein R6Q59_004464 [Mikania micrantha]
MRNAILVLQAPQLAFGTYAPTPPLRLSFFNENVNSTRRSYFLRRYLRSLFTIMTTSRRLADKKVGKFDKNITRRGSVAQTSSKKSNNYPVGPIMLGFFVFVVIGSSLVQIIRTATSGGMA